MAAPEMDIVIITSIAQAGHSIEDFDTCYCFFSASHHSLRDEFQLRARWRFVNRLNLTKYCFMWIENGKGIEAKDASMTRLNSSLTCVKERILSIASPGCMRNSPYADLVLRSSISNVAEINDHVNNHHVNWTRMYSQGGGTMVTIDDRDIAQLNVNPEIYKSALKAGKDYLANYQTLLEQFLQSGSTHLVQLFDPFMRDLVLDSASKTKSLLVQNVRNESLPSPPPVKIIAKIMGVKDMDYVEKLKSSTLSKYYNVSRYFSFLATFTSPDAKASWDRRRLSTPLNNLKTEMAKQTAFAEFLHAFTSFLSFSGYIPCGSILLPDLDAFNAFCSMHLDTLRAMGYTKTKFKDDKSMKTFVQSILSRLNLQCKFTYKRRLSEETTRTGSVDREMFARVTAVAFAFTKKEVTDRWYTIVSLVPILNRADELLNSNQTDDIQMESDGNLDSMETIAELLQEDPQETQITSNVPSDEED